MQSQKNRFRVKTPPRLHIVATMLVLTYNFATAFTETTTLNLCTLTTTFQLASSFQNCELKQEPCTLTTKLQQTIKFRGHEKTKKSTLATAIHYFFKHRHRERKYFFAPERWGRNCSEFVASGDTFVLTLNRASAVKVEGNE